MARAWHASSRRRFLGTLACLATAIGVASADPATQEAATRDLRAAVVRIVPAAAQDAGALEGLRSAFALAAPWIATARPWIAERELASVVYRKQPAVTVTWGANHDLASEWNDLRTLALFHGAAPKEPYMVLERRPAFWRLQVGIPVSRRWKLEYGKDDDQLSATLTQQALGGGPLRVIKIWYYRWDTRYSGVDGENCQKLAEVLLESDRSVIADGARDASKKPEIRRLNRQIPRAYFYFVRGVDPDDKRLKRFRSWYFKGKTHTFAIEVIEEQAGAPDEAPVRRWQREEGDPELALFLESISVQETLPPR